MTRTLTIDGHGEILSDTGVANGLTRFRHIGRLERGIDPAATPAVDAPDVATRDGWGDPEWESHNTAVARAERLAAPDSGGITSRRPVVGETIEHAVYGRREVTGVTPLGFELAGGISVISSDD